MNRSSSPVTVVSCHDPSGDRDLRSGSSIPQAFICPLTLNVMMDPVMDVDGNSYERLAIVEWLARNGTSPVTRNPLRKNHLVPNRALRELIFDHMGPEWSRNAQEELRAQAVPKQEEQKPPSPTPHASVANNEYRAAIDSFLEQISRAVGKNIRLNDHGICAFTYEQLTIVVEVPEALGSFFIYSQMNYDPAKRLGMLQKAMELNYLQQETMGGCLSCENANNGGNNLFFSYTDRVEDVDSTDFRNILENFIDTALTLSAVFKAL